MHDFRKDIGTKVRDLRKARRWTQAELAARLDLSQARLSQIERGNGSFAAEHLLEIFRLFNVDASHFSSPKSRSTREDQLWNAVARLGAVHLVESESVLPSERVQELHDVLREALVSATTPRLLTGLAPVLVAHAGEVQLHVVENELARLGLTQRLGWLVENTLEALGQLAVGMTERAVASRYRRAQVVLSSWLRSDRRVPERAPADILDAVIRSQKTRDLIAQRRSAISARWGIVSDIQPADFVAAIEAAREAR